MQRNFSDITRKVDKLQTELELIHNTNDQYHKSIEDIESRIKKLETPWYKLK